MYNIFRMQKNMQLFEKIAYRLNLHSFPTRRSSDLASDIYGEQLAVQFVDFLRPQEAYTGAEALIAQMYLDVARAREILRSEEHTSELQSHVNLVCRLLLEKKNKRKICSECRNICNS